MADKEQKKEQKKHGQQVSQSIPAFGMLRLLTSSPTQKHTPVDSKFPCFLPMMPELCMSKDDFTAYVSYQLKSVAYDDRMATKQAEKTWTDEVRVDAQHASASASGSGSDSASASNSASVPASAASASVPFSLSADAPAFVPGSAFMDGLLSDPKTVPSFDDRDDKMRTENDDVAFRTSKEPLVDLFYELEEVVSAKRLEAVLDQAWVHDELATLKLIVNTRSIHLGKASKIVFYRAMGWLCQKHPLTLLQNLQWIVRPIIQKKAPKPDEETKDASKAEDQPATDKDGGDEAFEMLDKSELSELEGQPPAKKAKTCGIDANDDYDVQFGVAHGYWKDLLNLLVLSMNGQLTVDGDPRSILNVPKQTNKKRDRDFTPGRKKQSIAERQAHVCAKLDDIKGDKFYQTLHWTVARLFAEKLKMDMERLASKDPAQKKLISLCGKWAPSLEGMHDQHTLIATSIAEILYPFDKVCGNNNVDPADRETYLKYARAAYQAKTLSPLRKHLRIVERSMTANKYNEIMYDRVPSIAMHRYAHLFVKKDNERFEEYLERVASGKAKISGATLLPSTLVRVVTNRINLVTFGGSIAARVEKKAQEMNAKVADGQWKALAQRIKDSGKLESSIAVCDVSGSMTGPIFPDQTRPIDSAIGLSLLLAEVTEPPFGGAFITFSECPQVLRVGGPDDKRSLAEKVEYIADSSWSMNTDFEAVFTRLILPMAVNNNLKPEEMVKQIFVFSDMQFDAARKWRNWSTSYERIKEAYADAGYSVPKLIFWNLAGGRAGYCPSGFDGGDDTAPKPVTADEENTALVSGYSQGQMKMFLDNGKFEDPGEEEEDEVEDIYETPEGEVVVEKKQKKTTMNPLNHVMKAIGHEAYRMLRIVD
jgi:hypothetical protein